MHLLLQTNRQHQDPTNQAGNRQKANRDNNRRLNRALERTLSLIDKLQPKRIDKKDIQTNLIFFEYEDQIFFDEILDILDEELETEDEQMPLDWYYTEYDETAYRSGTLQENAWIFIMLAGASGLFTDQAILNSVEYQRALALVQANDYRLLKGLSRTTSNQVFQTIQSGMAAGLSKPDIKKEITRRFNVAKTASSRIVNTEINKAYNNARLNLAQFYIDRGEPLAIIHISALLTTTRPHHARRHGKAYTPEAQRRWWDTGSNRINCHCSTRAAKTDVDGNIENTTAQQKIIKQGQGFFKK